MIYVSPSQVSTVAAMLRAANSGTRVIYVSPSQVSTFLACGKQWGFEKLLGRPRPESPKMAFGKEVHAVLEAYLLDGAPFPRTPAGRVAAQAVRPDWIPPPRSPGVIGETELAGPLPGFPPGVECSMYADVLDAREYRTTGRVVVVDYKTTSDLRWAKTEAELASDPQALMYAAWAIREGAREVLCRWIYLAATNPQTGPREPRGARAVEVVVRPGPALMEAMGPTLEAVREIARLRGEGGAPADVVAGIDGDTTSCARYGGCPHRHECPLGQDPATAIAALVDQDVRTQARKRALLIARE